MTQAPPPNDPWSQPPPGQYQGQYQQYPPYQQRYDQWGQVPQQYCMPRPRPTMVTLLGVLNYLGGVLMIFAAAGIAWAASVWSTLDLTEDQRASVQVQLPSYINDVGAFLAFAAVYALALAVVYFVLGWGLMSGKRWAPNFGLAIAIIGAAMGLVTYNGATTVITLPFNLIITFVIYWYLTETQAKEWFRHA